MSPKTKIILTADDFGVEDSINQGIVELVKKGLINSVEVLCNYGSNGTKSANSTLMLLEEAVSANKSIEIGVHCTLTSGSPLTTVPEMNSILNHRNQFKSYEKLVSNVPFQTIKNELIAQVNVLLRHAEIAPYVTHISCHHDALWFYPIYTQAYISVAREFKLAVRNPISYPPYRTWAYYVLKNQLKLQKESTEFELIQHAYELRKIAQFPGKDLSFCTTDYMDNRFYSLQNHLTQVDPRDRKKNIRNKGEKLKRMFAKAKDTGVNGKPAELVEFMFHVRKGKILESANRERRDLPFYSGIDTAYFDGRVIEFETLLKNEYFIQQYMQANSMSIGSWTNCSPLTLQQG
jgi:predicted glycoside hydrolase/deacetylase ChbG (UPF0249 family)